MCSILVGNLRWRVGAGLVCVLILTVPGVLVAAPFATGADASWYTQMVHDEGYIFYTQQGIAEPCLNVLQGVGINSVRLRVWLNPAGGWCNEADVVSKALAANALGQRVMLDFHFGDTWTSGTSQTPPAAWANYSLTDMEAAVAGETASVLNSIKSGGGTVSWVQVGNEINVGMLFPLGGVGGYGANSFPNLAGLIDSGYDAVKSVFPDALVIVHLSGGENDTTFEWFFDNLKSAGGKFDVIGMSAYPYWAGLPWQTEVADVAATMKDMLSRYGVPTMVCECGYQETDPTNCYNYLSALLTAAKSEGSLGVFYWEPECYGSWPPAAAGGTYAMGAFTAGGQPSAGMNAFLDSGVSPYFTGLPASQTIVTGGTVAFNAPAAASPLPTYQWSLGSSVIAGATSPTLLINGASSANAGSYTCTAANSVGTVTSRPATLNVVDTANPGRLINLSTRANVGTGGNILIAGFAVSGSGRQQLLIRASGPALVPFGVTGTLPDPQLQLFNGSTGLATNNGWAGDTAIGSDAASVGAFAWNSPSSHDSALASQLGSGSYTAQVSGQSGDTGVALAEIYDATPAASLTPSSPRLVNLSARVMVGTGGNILIAGFVIGGETSATVLVRASGPALAPFGVKGTLSDPQLLLFSGTAMLAANYGWAGNSAISGEAASIGAFAWSSPTSNDSALLLTLPPGSYTAQVAGGSGDTGVALVEVYQVR